MKMPGAVQLVLAMILFINSSALPSKRIRRQAHVEFKEHFFPFKDMCAKRMNVPTRYITRYLTVGVPGGKYCSYYILQCQDSRGRVARYLEECGIGMWWSFETGTCDIPSLTNRNACSKEICPASGSGSVPDPRACYGFYECSNGKAFFEMCEDTSFFNPATGSCENSPTCDRPGMATRPNGLPCRQSDLPRVCTPPGYIPSLAYCGCVHQHLER